MFRASVSVAVLAMLLAGCDSGGGGGGGSSSSGSGGNGSLGGVVGTSSGSSSSTSSSSGAVSSSSGVVSSSSGGSTGSSGGTDSGASAGPVGGVVTPIATPTPTAAILTEADAVRLAKQASFGPTPALVARIKELGLDGWLDEQFSATGSTYTDLAANPVKGTFCSDAADVNICWRQHFTRTPASMRFYANAVMGPDQLRQRVAFALGQMFVASEQESYRAVGIASFQQIMLDNSFGNFRDMLMQVTMSGQMGDYLDMADSSKNAPSENYARELLQLFSMGPDQLNMDGSPRLDTTGGRIPNYGPDDIRGIARALTGWTFARIGGGSINDGSLRDDAQSMITVPARYDTTAKSFLGTSVSAGASQEASVAAVVDAAFNNSSTAPFVARHLIAHLVTPNPTPAYIGRVATVFADNGKGKRGDMKAVVRAILTDSEARTVQIAAAGKLKEPVLLMTSLARLIGFTTDGYVFTTRDTTLGQPVFRAPSVFNFYPIDYPLPGSIMLRSPVSKLLNTSNALRWHNLVYDWTIAGDASRSEYTLAAGIPNSSSTQPNWGIWEAMGTDLDAMVARIDLLMFANTLTTAQKTALKAAGAAITNTDPATQARKRAQVMLYAAASSPLFLVDR